MSPDSLTKQLVPHFDCMSTNKEAVCQNKLTKIKFDRMNNSKLHFLIFDRHKLSTSVKCDQMLLTVCQNDLKKKLFDKMSTEKVTV